MTVKGCKPPEQAHNTLFPILRSPYRFQPLAQMPSHCVPLCVRLCLTRRTSAQNTVSTARAASCLRKAGLPVQRALLQGCRHVSSAPDRRIRTCLYSVKKRRELESMLQRRHSRDLLLELNFLATHHSHSSHCLTDGTLRRRAFPGSLAGPTKSGHQTPADTRPAGTS